MRPPALKKYLAASALAQVTVLVNVIDQVAPDVAVVLLLVPVQPVNSLPLETALSRLLLIFVMSVLILLSTSIRFPATGADLEVIVVFVPRGTLN
jgi:hypothetical protein